MYYRRLFGENFRSQTNKTKQNRFRPKPLLLEKLQKITPSIILRTQHPKFDKNVPAMCFQLEPVSVKYLMAKKAPPGI